MGNFYAILGTSGAGKTTAMRKVISVLQPQHATWSITHHWVQKKDGKDKQREMLLATLHHDAAGSTRTFAVVGNYNSVCGGVDSLSAPGIADPMYDALNRQAPGVEGILMEGLIQLQPGRLIWLGEQGHNVDIWLLNTSLDQCLANISSRRKERGDVRELDPTNTKLKFDGMARLKERLRAGHKGINVHEASADDTAGQMLELMKVPI